MRDWRVFYLVCCLFGGLLFGLAIIAFGLLF
jgi:hypothetical protein